MAYETHNFQTDSILSGRFVKIAALSLSCAVLAALAFNFDLLSMAAQLSDPAFIAEIMRTVGPVAVVILLALAVVVSPIPSGPVAMAAGAMFGTVEGGALTALGAVMGALIAFWLSRSLGYRPLSASKLPIADWITRPRPEHKLALIVLVSRLIPFISFDAVSYVAGLTSLRPRNFAIATTLGVLPASFAFAALGAGMATLDNVMVMIFACGVTAVLPLGWAVIRILRKRVA